MKKLIFVINGCGGVGKDTLCAIAAKSFRVTNISSITPIKEFAALCGWQGDKSDRSRRFLSDLKRLTIQYNDYPTRWVYEQYQKFLAGDDEILFVHIREPEEIRKFVKRTEGRAKTLLIRGGRRFSRTQRHYGNHSDDDVEKYRYDYYFMNDKPLHEIEPQFLTLLQERMSDL